MACGAIANRKRKPAQAPFYVPITNFVVFNGAEIYNDRSMRVGERGW